MLSGTELLRGGFGSGASLPETNSPSIPYSSRRYPHPTVLCMYSSKGSPNSSEIKLLIPLASPGRKFGYSFSNSLIL